MRSRRPKRNQERPTPMLGRGGCAARVLGLVPVAWILTAAPAVAWSAETGSAGSGGAEPLTVEIEESSGVVEADAMTGCYPQCRGGFYCLEGQCISPCNPPCQNRDLCTRGGRCIPDKPRPAVSPGEPALSSAAQKEAILAEARQRFNARQRDLFHQKRNLGIGLLVPGAALIATSVTLGAFAGVEDSTDFLIASLSVGLSGTALFVPGLVLAVQGKRGMEKARDGRFELARAKACPRLRLTGVGPLEVASDRALPSGVQLSFAF